MRNSVPSLLDAFSAPIHRHGPVRSAIPTSPHKLQLYPSGRPTSHHSHPPTQVPWRAAEVYSCVLHVSYSRSARVTSHFRVSWVLPSPWNQQHPVRGFVTHLASQHNDTSLSGIKRIKYRLPSCSAMSRQHRYSSATTSQFQPAGSPFSNPCPPAVRIAQP